MFVVALIVLFCIYVIAGLYIIRNSQKKKEELKDALPTLTFAFIVIFVSIGLIIAFANILVSIGSP